MSELSHLPHDPDVEASVLACVLIRPDLIRRCDFDIGAFYGEVHRTIYAAMLALDADEVPPDIVLIHSRVLESSGRSLKAELGALFERGAATSCFEAYVDRLKRLALQRCVVAIEEELSQMAQAPDWDPDEADAYRERRVREVRERFWPHESALEPLRAESRLREFYGRTHDWTTTIGWPSVDRIVGQIHPGSVITVLARPGVGKSALGLNVTANWLRIPGDWGVLYASLEMEGTLATDRLIRILEGWDQYRVAEAMRSNAAPLKYRRLTANRFCLFARSRQSLTAIERSIEVWRRAHNRRIRAVIVDYFQYLAGQRGETPYERASRLSRELKELAKEHEVLVLNLCQVGRGEAGGQGTSCPGLEGARDSGTIEENADVLLGMWRPKLEDPVLMLKALKVRSGLPGQTAELHFRPETMRLVEAAASSEENEA